MLDPRHDIPAPGPHPAPESDEALARRAAAEPDAFAQLYARYLPRVYAYCASRLGTREAAEDATSQVFLNAYAALPRLRADNVRAWLFTIAHHVVTDLHRRGGRHLALDGAEALPDRTTGPEQQALARDAGAELRRALGGLTDDQRRVIELRLAGLTGPEIRSVLGRSRSWVDTTQHRALRRLRRLLPADPAPAAKEDPDAPS